MSLLLKALVSATLLVASVFSPNSLAVVTNIALSSEFAATNFIGAALEFETSKFDFGNASQAVTTASCHVTATNSFHANPSKGKLPLWRAFTQELWVGRSFVLMRVLLLPP